MCEIAFRDLVAFFAFCLTGETNTLKRERVSVTRQAFWLYCGHPIYHIPTCDKFYLLLFAVVYGHE